MREEILRLAEHAEDRCRNRFQEIDRTALRNTERVLSAFRNHRVSEACLGGTTGYGYDDLGRETLDKIYAELLGTDSALVRIGFVNGTHALTAALFALAKPGQHLLSVTGLPYDTLQEVIGILRDDKSLLQKFESASMHVNPDSTFWVRDTSRNMLFMRKPQFFGGRNGQLYSARDDDYHYRLSIVYFSNGSLIW